ncbi:uncharacterized protein DNG_02565 [Cephalotrichum gorgonifer]|uniref:AAA+ ATPase domain-containing protein n=1 Tax=Cephalotrichum gorgonifer TaxID=2041049 RepID=A0AAE8STE7_9PEZI|nr:uncharacterized protein DNG_02565 [Cephalotrichum gorgonifer]
MPESTADPLLSATLLEAKYADLEKRYEDLAQENGVVKAPTEGVEPKSGPGPVESEGEKKESASRVKILISKKDPNQNERVEVPEESQAKETPSESNQYAFILKKHLHEPGPNQDNDNSVIDIKDPQLWALLKSHLEWYPDHVFRGPPVTLHSPYEAIVYSWDALKEAANEKPANEDDKRARDDLELLLGAIGGGSSGDAKLDNYFKARDVYRINDTIAFQDLWTIFPPGTLVYGTPFQKQHQLFIVQGHTGETWPEEVRPQQFSPWSMRCWIYDWNGDRFKRTSMKISIEDEIDAKPSFRQTSLTRLILGLGARKSSSLRAPKSSQVDSRVMVDYQSYFQYGPSIAQNGSLEQMAEDTECMCLECQTSAVLRRKYRTDFDQRGRQDIDEDWVDEQLMICPPRVLGYVLGAKQWAQLEVDKVVRLPPSDNSGPWSRLQLADEGDTKELLLNLVKSHISSSSGVNDGSTGLEVDDITPGKGKGLVILLYGPPGVGKTSTAETIAAASSKPLFSISVADVGTKATNVEANLAKIFSLATSWQAILLIDEADVFLESRGRVSMSTEKNALVSVFLRVLEYYQGIMFLTTNQIKQFDIAIPSRIHIAIKYDQLTNSQMEAIFRGFLDPLESKGMITDYKGMLGWLKEDVYYEKFDGRQIRNLVTTALGLARADSKEGSKPVLTKRHMMLAFRNCKSFKDEWLLQYNSYMQDQKMRPM